MKTHFLILASLFITTFLVAQFDDNMIQTKYLELSDTVKIAYLEEGQGRHTFLFLHGLGSNNKAWSKNISHLKNIGTCIAIDLPGYGASSKGDYPFTMTFFAEQVLAFIEKKDLNDIVLVGHSMGGQIGIHTILKNSARFSKLILFAPAGFEQFSEREREWFQQIYTPAVVKAAPEAQIIKNFEINFYKMPEDARFMIADRLAMRKTAAYDYHCEMIPKCVMGMLQEPVFDQLPNLKIPTLIFYGKQDLLIPNRLLHSNITTENVGKEGQSQIIDSQLVMVDEAGHFVQWEQP
jgi:pimeloyl-ACP methyl ester carboxylesterase